MKINGATKIFGVCGNPVKHSFSPQMHNFLFNKFKLNGIYLPFEIQKEKFKDFINGMRNITNIVGLNITIPFKNEAFEVADVLSDEAKVIGSINTLYFKGERIYGYNTDTYGFLKAIKINYPDFKFEGKNILLLGAGGVSKSILYSLIISNVRKIYIVNRTLKRAEKLCDYFSEKMYFNDIEVLPLDFNILKNINDKIDVIINSTSIGLKKDDPLLIKLSGNIELVYDIIYNPPETKLLSEAKKLNINVLNGLDMLILQGVKSFEIWNNLHNISNNSEILRDLHKIFK